MESETARAATSDGGISEPRALRPGHRSGPAAAAAAPDDTTTKASDAGSQYSGIWASISTRPPVSHHAVPHASTSQGAAAWTVTRSDASCSLQPDTSPATASAKAASAYSLTTAATSGP